MQQRRAIRVSMGGFGFPQLEEKMAKGPRKKQAIHI
jgi:hypothetical protein